MSLAAIPDGPLLFVPEVPPHLFALPSPLPRPAATVALEHADYWRARCLALEARLASVRAELARYRRAQLPLTDARVRLQATARAHRGG